MTTRRERRRARTRRRRLWGTVTAFILMGLSFAAVKFAPLVTTPEPPPKKRVISYEYDGYSQPLDAWGMAQSGLDYIFQWVKAVNDIDWYRQAIMYDHWLRIGHCEQPGSGPIGTREGVDWNGGGTNHEGTFFGGLGIRSDAWAQNSYGISPDVLWTPEGQMIVATRIFQYAGPGGWGCK